LGAGNVANLQVLWDNPVTSTINTSPMVANGIVYYGDYTGDYYAVDAVTGDVKWQVTESYSNDAGVTSGLTENGSAVACGILYVTERCTYSSCGTVYAFDAATGAIEWTFSSSTESPGDPVVSDNVIYFALGSGTQALNATTGAPLWAAAQGGSPAVGGGYVYVTYGQPASLLALQASNGALAWTGILPSGSASRPTVASSFVYVTSSNGALTIFPASGCGSATCSPTQTYTLPEPPDATAPSVTAAAVSAGNVFVASGSNVSAFDAAPCAVGTCAAVWSTSIACASVGPQPSVANGVVYVACGDDLLIALSAASGQQLWTYSWTTTDYPLRSAPAIVDGRLFIGATFAFKMYAFALP
jgi:outer membrane protein assembly factor BamB